MFSVSKARHAFPTSPTLELGGGGGGGSNMQASCSEFPQVLAGSVIIAMPLTHQ